MEAIPADEVREHLERVLSSSQFRSSKRCRRFLTYVVQEALEGNSDSLKERTLAIDVFDRPASWDSGEDTIVRGGAREVRKRLAQFYGSLEGLRESLRFELPPGSYVPVLVPAEISQAEAPETELKPEGEPEVIPVNRSWIAWIAVAGLVTVITTVLAATFKPASAFEEFWRPIWGASTPLLVAMAHPIVYHPSSRAARLSEQRLGSSPLPLQRPLKLLPNEMDGSDIVPVIDQYVGYGDSAAASNIAVLMGQHKGNVSIRSADRIEFVDLRETPTVLIGSFTNRWTAELTQSFQFHFGYDAQGGPALLDAANKLRRWNIPSKKDDGTSAEDYFLVCRLANTPSGQPMLIAAGLTQFGTEAAGRFLTDPKQLNYTLGKIGGTGRSATLRLFSTPQSWRTRQALPS